MDYLVPKHPRAIQEQQVIIEALKSEQEVIIANMKIEQEAICSNIKIEQENIKAELNALKELLINSTSN